MSDVLAPNPALEPRWTARRWVVSAVLLLALHGLLIYQLSEREEARVADNSPGTQFRWAGARAEAPEAKWSSDPLVSALASPHGFSGSAWLREPESAYVEQEWREPAKWLPISATALGDELTGAAQASGPRLTAQGARPALTAVASHDFFKELSSSVRLDAILQSRLIGVLPSLPQVEHPFPVTNTVLRVALTADGAVFPPVVWSSSGSPAADQLAVNAASAMRFSPLPSSPEASPASALAVTPGRMVFTWATVPPSSTNMAAAQP